MFKFKVQLYFILLMSLTGFKLQADISAVVIETDYKMGVWQPLPEDKIKSAAVDSALSEISKTKRFAFFTSKQPGLKAGNLKISVKLIEAAETATVSILLQQVDGVSFSSTYSESLKNQSYSGIYKRFQRAGLIAGKKIVEIIESQSITDSHWNASNDNQKRINYLENQIVNINNKIIQQSGNNSVRSEAKLEYILKELSSIKSVYNDLAKKEDIQKQSIKIDKVIDEVGQLNKKIDSKPVTQINVKQNYIVENALIGQSKLSSSSSPGRDDKQARRLYNEAQELKRGKKYKKSEIKLQQAMRLSISSDLSGLILDELNYSLPMFEAQSIAIDLGRNFQSYYKTGKHKLFLDRITLLYKTALKNNQHDFQRTRQIQQMLDQHLNTSQAMSAAISVQNKSNGRMIHQYMRQNYQMEGQYPDKKKFNELLKRYGLRYKVLYYQASANKYNVKLRSVSGDSFVLSVDEYGELKVD